MARNIIRLSGTPTDSVMMALGVVMKDNQPDLLLSGVNRGANLGDDITYSGTVSAAMEGALAGIRSIALSQVYGKEGMGDAVPFSAAEAWGPKVLKSVARHRICAAYIGECQLPARLIPTRSKAFKSRGRAFTITAGALLSKVLTRVAMIITGSACTAWNIHQAMIPIWSRRRRLCRCDAVAA